MQKLQVLVPGAANDHDRIQAVFGRTLYVHLTRQHKLDQAISYVKALQTGLWHKAPDGQELERHFAPEEPVYDAKAIQRHLTDLSAMDESWIAWFAKEELNPLRISYEDLSDDPLVVAGGLLKCLGLNEELANNLKLPVAKLADATNRQWAQRFAIDTNL